MAAISGMEEPASLKRKDSLVAGIRMAFHKEDAILLDLDNLPNDLAAALREYDFDGDGNVSVNEIVAGARTLKRQKEKNATFVRVIILLVVFSFLQLGALFGVVWGVVSANTQTRVTGTQPVMMVKGTDTPVQVSSSDFFVDSAGILRLRPPADVIQSGRRHLLEAPSAPVLVSSNDFSFSDGLIVSKTGSATASNLASLVATSFADLTAVSNVSDTSVRRRLLGASVDSGAAPMTVFTPVCDWTSTDLYDPSTCASGSTFSCTTLINSCSQFLYSNKVGIFMLSNGGSASNQKSMKPAALALTVPRIDYIFAAYRISNSVCAFDLYRIYTQSDMTSYVDLCMYPLPTKRDMNMAPFDGDIWCPKCPVGPFLDYTNLKFDDNAFDLPCKTRFAGDISIENPNNVATFPKHNIPNNYCFLSLGFVYDPNFLFDTQFTQFPGSCSSPFRCPSSSQTSGRHLLQTKPSKSGLGAKA